MGMVIFINDNGVETIVRKNVKNESDILFRSDYIATVLWSREDVEDALLENGFKGTAEEIDAVINTGYLRALEDCTDGDWYVIDDAIREAERRGEITPIEEEEDDDDEEDELDE